MKGGEGYRFNPTRKLKALGYSSKAFGHDEATAVLYTNAIIAEIKELESNALDRSNNNNTAINGGTMKWLIGRFEKDHEFYRDKAPATIKTIDYVFRIINAEFGDNLVQQFKRKHCKAWYSELRDEGSHDRANKCIKYLKRLFQFAVDQEIIASNPAAKLGIKATQPRKQTWTRVQIKAVIETAMAGGITSSGNIILERPSIALATMIGYDTSLPEQDILALTQPKLDGQNLRVIQKKSRGENIELFLPLSDPTLRLMDKIGKPDFHLIINEKTGKPYNSKDDFGRVFRKVRERAGLKDVGLQFRDIRRTALTELGANGATNAEIAAMSGHNPSSPMLKVYVVPTEATALNAHKKRALDDF